MRRDSVKSTALWAVPWLSRGLYALTSFGVTILAAGRLGAEDAARLLVAIALAQVVGALTSSFSLVRCLQAGIRDEPLMARRPLVVVVGSPLVVGAATALTVSVTPYAVDFTGGVVAGVLLGLGRCLGEYAKGIGRYGRAQFLEGGILPVASLLAVLTSGSGELRPLAIFVGPFVVGVALSLSWPIAEGPFVGRHEEVRTKGRVRLGETATPLLILAATYGPLILLQAGEAGSKAIATYSIVQRSLAVVTIGLSVVATTQLRQIGKAWRESSAKFWSATVGARRQCRLIVLPLAGFGSVIALESLHIAGLLTYDAIVLIALLSAAQLHNAWVGIPTEIALACGMGLREMFGAGLGVTIGVAVYLLSPGEPPVVAGLAVLSAQTCRNLWSVRNVHRLARQPDLYSQMCQTRSLTGALGHGGQ